jgi:hypothetical protein
MLLIPALKNNQESGFLKANTAIRQFSAKKILVTVAWERQR